jgi:hypothetical protein
MKKVTTKVTLAEASKIVGKTNWLKLKSMTDEEIEQAIVSDIELREIPHCQLAKAKRTRL